MIHKKNSMLALTIAIASISVGQAASAYGNRVVNQNIQNVNNNIELMDSTYYYDFPVVDTGQYDCYTDDGETLDECPAEGEEFYGQDAQYDGYEFNFTDNGDGTVTDNVTGLIWQQEAGTQSDLEGYDGDSSSTVGMSFEEAEDYCESLTLADLDDWRLPTTKELFSLQDFSEGWPYVDTDYFYLAIDTETSKDEQYWTEVYVGVTVEGSGSYAAFAVNEATGHIKAYNATATGQFGNFVRCVSGNEISDNNFVDNGDGTVTDYATGLMWAQDDSGEGMVWADALEYAESSELAGYSDWRLPNVKELQSIVDYTKSPSATDEDNIGPAIDTDYFNITELDTSLDTVTSNTENDYGYFWSSTSAYFNESAPDYYYGWYVAFGTAVNDDGDDYHGAGAVRFDTKAVDGPAAEEAERYYNYVRLVRDID